MIAFWLATAGLVFAIIGAAAQSLEGFYVLLAKIFDRKYWRAAGAKRELDKQGKIDNNSGTKALVQITGADFLLRQEENLEDAKARKVLYLGSPNDNPEVLIVREDQSVPGSPPNMDRRLFERMYATAIQSRQNRMAILFVVPALVLGFIAFLLTT